MGDEINEMKDEEKEKLAAEPDDQGSSDPVEGAKSNGGLIAGVILIGLGLIFLFSNITGFQLNNWWALFILVPGIASFINGWKAHNEDGRWSKRARGGILGGAIVSLVAFIFLFNLDWSQMWPVIIILVGIFILLGAWLDR